MVALLFSENAQGPPGIVARVASGDEASFVALVEQYKPLVFRWAVALCGDEDDAEDISQEVFVRVYRKLSSFRGDGSFEGWLYRITRRVLLRSRRKLARPQQHRDGDADFYTTDPGLRIDQQRAVDLIRAIAGALPLRQREVFVLCDLEGRTPAEVAKLIGMKDVSVRASLFKARESIRRTVLASHPRFTEHQK